MHPTKTNIRRKQPPNSGIVAIEAFQTSDGTYYVEHKDAKSHEANYQLAIALRKAFDCWGSDTDIIIDGIMDKPDEIAAALAIWKKTRRPSRSRFFRKK